MKSSVRSRGVTAVLGLGLCLVALPTAPAQAQAQVQVPCDVAALRNAIIASNSSGADLTLARNCTYTLTDAYSGQDGLPPVTGTYTINGVGVTIQRASAAQFRILHVAPGAHLTLNHVTLVGGQTSFIIGGGVYNQGTLSATQVTVRDTQSEYAYGAGIANWGGTLSMQRGSLSNNTAFLGGGLLTCGGTATLNNVSVTGNSAWDGGGLNNNCSSTLNLNATTVQNNNAQNGGGVINWTDFATTGTRITGNTAEDGGGLAALSGTATLTDSRVTGNTARTAGGGILAFAPVTLVGTTVTQNTPDNCYPPGSVAGCTNTAALASKAAPSAGRGLDPQRLAKAKAYLKKYPAIQVNSLD